MCMCAGDHVLSALLCVHACTRSNADGGATECGTARRQHVDVSDVDVACVVCVNVIVRVQDNCCTT
jgi:hypothetical protein